MGDLGSRGRGGGDKFLEKYFQQVYREILSASFREILSASFLEKYFQQVFREILSASFREILSAINYCRTPAQEVEGGEAGSKVVPPKQLELLRPIIAGQQRRRVHRLQVVP